MGIYALSNETRSAHYGACTDWALEEEEIKNYYYHGDVSLDL